MAPTDLSLIAIADAASVVGIKRTRLAASLHQRELAASPLCAPRSERNQAVKRQLNPSLLLLIYIKSKLPVLRSHYFEKLREPLSHLFHQNALGAAVFIGPHVTLRQHAVKLLRF